MLRAEVPSEWQRRSTSCTGINRCVTGVAQCDIYATTSKPRDIVCGYQLRMPCPLYACKRLCGLNRKGKLRGGKVLRVPTDLSDVLDLLDCSTWQGAAILSAYSNQLQKEVYGLADHPGIVFIPAAASP